MNFRWLLRSAAALLIVSGLSGLFGGSAYAYDDGILEREMTIKGTLAQNINRAFDNDVMTTASLSRLAGSITIELDQPYVLSSFRYTGLHDTGMEIRYYTSLDEASLYKIYSLSSVTDDTPYATTDATEPVRKVIIRNKSFTQQLINEFELYGVPVAPTGRPEVLALGGPGWVTLIWSHVEDSLFYNVFRSESPTGPYSAISVGVTGQFYQDLAVTPGTTYYYMVVAANDGGFGPYSAPVSATPYEAPTVPRALLSVHLTDGTERQYDLPLSEAEAFAQWVETRSSTGAGLARYWLETELGEGGFANRDDYIVHQEIELYEIIEL